MQSINEMNYIDEFASKWKQMERQLHLLQENTNFLICQSVIGCDEWLNNAYNKHQNERCFLVGTGPSLNQLDLSLLKNEIVMACNGAILIKEMPISYFISVSHYFYKNHIETINQLRCDRCFLPQFLKELEPSTPTTWMNTIEGHQYQQFGKPVPYKFSLDPGNCVFLGGTVMFPAFQILHYLGFKEVILIGVDHNYGNFDESKNTLVESSGLKAHFTPNYYTQPTQVHIDFPAMNRSYNLSNDTFRKSGRKILNATPGTKLKTFPLVDYKSLF